MMEWAPGEGMRTVAGQLAEIGTVEVALVPFLRDGRHMTWEEADAAVGDLNDCDSLKQALIDIRQTTLDYLDTLSEEDLHEEVECGKAWFGTFWPTTLPRAEVFLNVCEHEFYHVGQLTTYLWTRGDNPYKW
jgi:uncharacterized damage-inducible protein DinB